MFYPKTKHTKPERTSGLEYVLANGQRYVGFFITLFNGRGFSGNKFGPDSQELFPSGEPLGEDIGFEVEGLRTQDIPQPKERDYERGVIQRYFLRDKRTGKIVEVDSARYREERNTRGVDRASIIWTIKGPDNSYSVNGYKVPGVAEKNYLSVEEAQMEGLHEYIDGNYTKYNQAINPINPDDPSVVADPIPFVIPSPGKKL